MNQSHTIDLDGVQIQYVEAPGPGPALVILHGITGSSTGFAPILPSLAQQAHVYAVDLRGHNLSSHTPDAYLVADYGRDVAAFLQRVVRRPAVVAGHSLGGVITVWLAAHAPESVQGIFLEDPPLYIIPTPRLEATPYHGSFVMLRSHLRQHHARNATLEDLIPFVAQMPVNATQSMLEVAGSEAVRMRAVELHRLDPSILDPAIDGALLGPYDADDLVSLVRCPIHLLAAQYELSMVMSAQDVARFVAHAPHCTYTVLEGVGHGIHVERPEVYVATLRQFITETG